MDTKPVILFWDSYLAFITNSVGSGAFRTVYALVNGQRTDLINDGENACAYFVSSVLKLSEMIDRLHLTVTGTVRALEESGWEKVDVTDMQPGDVIVWEAKQFNDGPHRHIGFFVGDGQAVSTSSLKKAVDLHEATSADGRAIEAVYRWTKRQD